MNEKPVEYETVSKYNKQKRIDLLEVFYMKAVNTQKTRRKRCGRAVCLAILLMVVAGCAAFWTVDDTDIVYARTIVQNWVDGIRTLGTSDTAGNASHELKGSGAMEGTGKPQESGTLEEPVNTGEDYSFDEEIYPYYSFLSDEQKAVYRQVYANAVAENSSRFTLVAELDESELSDAVCAVYNDHPEIFWLETTYSYSYDSSGTVKTLQLYYYMTGAVLKQAQSSFDSAVQTLVSGAASYSTEIEQELYVHDAINAKASYNANADMNQSAYSALVNGSTVCAGYARAFQYVMQELGYTVYYCTGTADGGDHAWNIIEIEGEFYNIDLTWDDSISEAYGSRVYTYFNLTDSAISVDHTRSGLSKNLPSCTATAMAYTTVYGDTISIDDVEVESGTHNEGDMVITPSAPEITDWTKSPQKEPGAEAVEPLPEVEVPEIPSEIEPQNEPDHLQEMQQTDIPEERPVSQPGNKNPS